MMNVIGAGLVFLSGTFFGFYKASQYANRPKQIRQLIQALQRLETEITYGYTPLPEALGNLALQQSEPLRSMFQEVADRLSAGSGATTLDSWQQAIQTVWKKTAMKSSERQTLSQLGFTLGISDRQDQIKHLRLAMNQLQSEEDAARDDQKRYESMWRSLGALGGALVVILMY